MASAPADAQRPTAAWDPAQYLRFSDQRLRPALDLLGQVPLTEPGRVVDLGCGAGNVTAILKQRFPSAEVTGVDGDAAMLQKARVAAPGCRFEQGDFATWVPSGRSSLHPSGRPAGDPTNALDVIFSNAALQWVGGHAILFPRLISLLAPGGVLAVQMPAMHDAPLRRLQYAVAAQGPWAERLGGHASAPPIFDPPGYWDLLRPLVTSLDIWETTYLHPLTGEDAVVEWAAGSSLRPFLEPLAPAQQAAFRRAYAEALRPHYPRRAGGTTLLPFRRLFLIARR
ncbi:MAG TPA: methyltransferase domain-containing protein [Acetobacteraceae bacterium]|jgi:trans-aconitate 2-methyltransferase|nr:methyltransferase domain-containing protein [Acetobacteraceae bacterium]